MYVFETEKGFDKYAETDAMLTRDFDVSAVAIDSRSLEKFEPELKPGLAGAFHYPGDTSVRPDLLNQQWREQLLAAGVSIVEDCRLNAVAKSGGNVVGLETSKGTMASRHVLVRHGRLECQVGQ